MQGRSAHTLVSKKIVVQGSLISKENMDLEGIFKLAIKFYFNEACHIKNAFYNNKEINYLKVTTPDFFNESGSYVDYSVFGGEPDVSKFEPNMIKKFLDEAPKNENFLKKEFFPINTTYFNSNVFDLKVQSSNSAENPIKNKSDEESDFSDYEYLFGSNSDYYDFEMDSDDLPEKIEQQYVFDCKYANRFRYSIFKKGS